MKILNIGLLVFSSFAFAQTSAPTPTAPTTTLESFLSQTGILTIRESLGKTSVPVLYGGSLSLEAIKLYTPGLESSALKGIRIGVNDGEKYSTMRYNFVELPEVDGMTQAVEYMSVQAPKLNPTLLPEMRFSSKSEITVGIFYSDYSKKFIGFAKVDNESVNMELSSLSALRQVLLDLKSNLK